MNNDIHNKIIEYYQKHPDKEQNIYCIECGKLLISNNSKFVNKRDGSFYITGNSFLTTREYNGNIYHLSRCQDCVGKKFPQIYNAKSLYACKFAKYSQYAFNVLDEDFSAYTKKRQSLTKDRMIEKYGEIVGTEKWKQYCLKQSITNTFEYKHAKYGMTKEQFNEFNKSRACTKELFIKRHGEKIGLEKWKQYCDKQRYTTTLEYFINTYGQEKGVDLYRSFELSRKNFNGASKIATDFFKELQQLDIFKNNEVYYNGCPYEYSIDGYRVDFYDKTLNVVIEFYGDYWHKNPAMYKSSDIIIDPFDKVTRYTVQEIWDKDEKRKNNIVKLLNCIFIIIWEKDVIENKHETINKIIDIITKSNTN